MIRNSPRTQSLLTARREQKSKKLVNWWNGEFRDHSYGSCTNITNFLIFLLCIWTPIECIRYIYSLYEAPTHSIFSLGASIITAEILDTKVSYIPLLLAIKTKSLTLSVVKNFIFTCPLGTATIYLVLNSLFQYLMGIIFKSLWLFEATVSLVPLLIAIGWRQNPYASRTQRGDIQIALVLVWTLKTVAHHIKSRKFKFGT